jgi:ABC-type antimicrobial peptide transport system permease subunit
MVKIKVELYNQRRLHTFSVAITIPVIVGVTGTIKIFGDQIHNLLWKPIQVQVELIQSEKVPGSTFGATITISVIVGATGIINIFCEQIHNLLWKLI